MTSGPVRPYLGESAEDRVHARRQRLTDTAFELLATDGWRDVRIDALCKRAGLNKRYFYESFSRLDEVAAAVVDDLAANLLATALEAVTAARAAGAPPDQMARDAIGAAVDHITADPRRARVLFTEIAGSPAAIAQRRTTINGLARALSDYGHEHHHAHGTDPIAEVASALLIGGSAEAVIAWLDGHIAMTREQLIDDLAALWLVVGDNAADRARHRQAPG